MSRGHSDRTADDAIGNADKEWRYMASIALKLRNNKHSYEYEDQVVPMFTGIFARLLTDPIEDLEKAAGRRV